MYGTGETVQYVLGTFQTISPVLVLRWLRGEALRIANRLDPDPADYPAFSRGFWAIECDSVPYPDAPSELRVWASDPDEERGAREHIKGGFPLFVRVPDEDCTYTLSVWPVRMSAESDRWPGEPLTHRIGGLSNPLYVIAENPWR
ncbi:hypothetical protein AQJ67_37360 [Streptomyces caeruleatus]|uniref:Uncharacterized protein n=1 Tax=Streptomyces caeruleatus TaxID=661399 RepID=A0A117RJD2_9ACTN|nr:hypothetical protein AQJ67_37360 [Streptomyces caeruleatus]